MVVRGVTVDIEVGRDEDDEDEGREFDTTGDCETGEAMIGRVVDEPGS